MFWRVFVICFLKSCEMFWNISKYVVFVLKSLLKCPKEIRSVFRFFWSPLKYFEIVWIVLWIFFVRCLLKSCEMFWNMLKYSVLVLKSLLECPKKQKQRGTDGKQDFVDKRPFLATKSGSSLFLISFLSFLTFLAFLGFRRVSFPRD